MAIIEKVTLVDDYSAKAKKIQASTSAMASAMDSIRGNACKMGAALKSAFSRKYSVDIKDTGVANVNNRIKSLQSTLNGLNRPYNITITAKMGVMDKIKSNMSSIKSKASEMKASFRNFKLDYSTFKQAKKEAKDMEKALRNLTGRKHKIDIGMENPIKTAFKGGFSKMFGGLKSGFSKIGGFFSKLNPFKKSKSEGGPVDSDGGGPGLIKSIVGGNLITGAITKGIGAITNVAGSTIGAGFNRLQNIESAKARLKGFGYDNKQVNQITKSATNAVTGTQYSMGDAMTASSGAIAAGIKPGELEGYLKEVGNAAAATGSDFNDVASIMNKVKTTGHLQADEMRQLSDRGLPVLAKLAENAGVSVDEMSKKISKGNVSFDEFRKAVKSASGNASEEVAKTWGGAKDNFKSALSKIGAGILGGNDTEDGSQGGLFGLMTPALLKVNKVLNDMVPTFKNVGDGLKNFVTGGIEKGQKAFTKAKDFLSPITKKIGSKIKMDDVKSFIGGGIEKAKTGLSAAKDFLTPALEKARDGIGQTFDKLVEVFGPIKEKFATAFDTLAEAFAPVMESLSGLFGEGTGTGFDILGGVIDVVAGAFGVLADVIVALQPVWELLGSFIANTVIPALSSLGSWIGDTLVPKIVELADMVGGWVKDAFTFIGDAVNAAKTTFDNLVGAVKSAADALAGLPGKIGGWVSDKINSAKAFLGIGKKNATGTSYFSGGLTRINERGEEMMRLPQGTKIYPAGATRKAIEKEARNTSSTPAPTSPGQIVINVNGANMTNKDVGRVISNELKRLGVVV